MVYQYVGECIGGIMGNSAGALTSIEFAHDSTNPDTTVFLKSFQYYWCEPQLEEQLRRQTNNTTVSVPKRYFGKVVSFNPNDEGESDEGVNWNSAYSEWVDVATSNSDPAALYGTESVHGGAVANGKLSMPILWAQPYFQDTDQDARREWSVADGVEKPITMMTRNRVRSRFKFKSTKPTTGDLQWVPIGRIVSWIYASSGSETGAAGAKVPTSFVLNPIYVWDNHFLNGDVGDGTQTDTTTPTGQGVAKFSSESGTSPEASMFLAKPKPHGPGSTATGVAETESAPFANNGAVLSNIARGDWISQATAPPNMDFVGGDGAGNQPTHVGSTTSKARYPYPGSFYRLWDQNKGGSSELDAANNLPDNESHVYGELAEKGWVSLGDEGLNVDSYALWRLGIPQVMHLMRRQISMILDSQTEVEGPNAFGNEGGDEGVNNVDLMGTRSEGRPWYALPTDTGGLLQLRGSIAALTKRTDEQHLETVRHVRREIGGTDSLKGCFVAAAGKLSTTAGTTNPTFDGFGLTFVAQGNSEDVGSYYTWKIRNGYKILSVQITQNPFSTTNGIVNASHKMPVAYVAPLTDTQFAVYTAQSSMSVLNEVTGSQNLSVSINVTGDNIDDPVDLEVVTDVTANLESDGGATTEVGNFSVDFGKAWTEEDTRHDYYITVLAERVIL